MNLTLADAAGHRFADVALTHEQDGWFTGTVLAQKFPPDLREALDWYDEVVENQMLSYLDQATAAVERFGVHALYPDGAKRKLWSLHVNKRNEVFFRTSPVLPAVQLNKPVPNVHPSPAPRNDGTPIR